MLFSNALERHRTIKENEKPFSKLRTSHCIACLNSTDFVGILRYYFFIIVEAVVEAHLVASVFSDRTD